MNLEQRSAIDVQGSDSPSESRLGARSAAAQEFTCKVCGLKTHDITRPCPHWWGLLWGTKTKRRLPQQRRHWYRVTHFYCPICMGGQTYRERVYGRKPKRGAVDWVESWDGCNVL
jgi:hypothetical protein